ncbi:unnamed protein product, partial [Acidocella sp. C78]
VAAVALFYLRRRQRRKPCPRGGMKSGTAKDWTSRPVDR